MSDAEQPLSYRTSVARVEEIIRQIDRVDIDLDELAPLVEEAATLLAHCRALLDQTTVRVHQALERLSGDSEDA